MVFLYKSVLIIKFLHLFLIFLFFFQKFADPGKYALIGAAAMLGKGTDFYTFLKSQIMAKNVIANVTNS